VCFYVTNTRPLELVGIRAIHPDARAFAAKGHSALVAGNYSPSTNLQVIAVAKRAPLT
jgi:hypothetical protein